MELKDFVKDLSINMDSNNWKIYKQQAAALTIDVDSLTGDELADIINNGLKYDQVLEKIFQGDLKRLNAAVKKLMSTTEYPLYFVSEYYMKNKKAFKWFNFKTQTKLANPQLIGIENMTAEVIKYWLDDTTIQMYKETNMTNDFRFVVASNDKNIVTTVVNHKNFKSVASHYSLRDLLTKENLLTKTTFDKVLTRTMQIINSGRGWNTNFAKELAFLGQSQYLQVKHFGMFSNAQAEAIIEVAEKSNNPMDSATLEYLYSRTDSDVFLPQTAKDVFLF